MKNPLLALRLQQLIALYAPLRQRGVLLDGYRPPHIAAPATGATKAPVAVPRTAADTLPACREIAA